MAGSEIFTTCQITMRLKVKIWNSELNKLKKCNVCGGEIRMGQDSFRLTLLVYMGYLDIVLKKEIVTKR